MKKLAIVILNWNGADMMRQYLPSVLENSVGDVIVADNASTDGSVRMLLKEFPQVPVVVLEQNFGFAEGYDRALAQLDDYEYFLLLNSDVEIRQKEWDRPLIEYMDGHPECAACQPKLLKLQTQTLPSPSLEGGGSVSANDDTNEQGNHSLPVGRVRGGSEGSAAWTHLQVGDTVTHKSFGKGVVKSIDERFIIVAFAHKESRFPYPWVFEQGYMSV